MLTDRGGITLLLASLASRPTALAENDAPSALADIELERPTSAGALSDALTRARVCFERQLASGRPWKDVR